MRRLAALAALCAALSSCSGIGYRRPVTVEHPRVELPSGLAYEEVLPGLGPEAVLGSEVTLDYTAWLASAAEAEDGQPFDSSHDRGVPVSFVLGTAPLLAWDQGLLGMLAGGKRKLFVPPELAYGPEGVPGLVPPNSSLVFLIELNEVVPAPPPATEAPPSPSAEPPPRQPPAQPVEPPREAPREPEAWG